MPYNLKDKNVLITGGSRGLGASIARKFAAEGSNVAINYNSREEPARKLAEEIEKEYGVKTHVIRGDCGVTEDCRNCVKETISAFGGIDVVIGNAGWTKFTKNWGDLNALEEEDWDKCWRTNVWGQMAVFREALPTFNANPEGGVFIVTSSVAGTSISGSSMPYSITKCAQLHLMKCLAQTQGSKVRVNAVRPGLLLTEWGQQFGDEIITSIKDRSALKCDTDVEECADAFIWIAKNTMMTGQSIAVDAGVNVAAM